MGILKLTRRFGSRLVALPIAVPLAMYRSLRECSRDIYNEITYPTSKLGEGSVVDPNCCFAEHTSIGKHSRLLNVCIKRYSYVGEGTIAQNVSIGAFCSISSQVLMGLGAHPMHYFSTSPLFYKIDNVFGHSPEAEQLEFKEYKKINVGNDVWIGARAILLDGISVGNGSIIAAGAVVTRDVPAYSIVAGIPARIIRYRFNSEQIDELNRLAWWDWPLDKIVAERRSIIMMLDARTAHRQQSNH